MDFFSLLSEYGMAATLLGALLAGAAYALKYHLGSISEERDYQRAKEDKIVNALQDINSSLIKFVASSERAESDIEEIKQDTITIKDNSIRIDRDVQALKADMIYVKERISNK